MCVGAVTMLILLPFDEEASPGGGGHRAATMCFTILAASSGVESFSLSFGSSVFLVGSAGLSSAISRACLEVGGSIKIDTFFACLSQSSVAE